MTVNARWQSRRPRSRAAVQVPNFYSSRSRSRAIEIRYVNGSSGAGTTALSLGVHRHMSFKHLSFSNNFSQKECGGGVKFLARRKPIFPIMKTKTRSIFLSTHHLWWGKFTLQKYGLKVIYPNPLDWLHLYADMFCNICICIFICILHSYWWTPLSSKDGLDPFE